LEGRNARQQVTQSNSCSCCVDLLCLFSCLLVCCLPLAAAVGWNGSERKEEGRKAPIYSTKQEAKTVADVASDEFKSLGAAIMSRHAAGSAAAFNARWMSFFGVEPEVCEEVWRYLDADEPEDQSAEPVHLLWALLLVKTYGTEAVLAGICGGGHKETFSKWAWHFLEKISYLEPEVVSSVR
jgi:hypothetical protein